MKKFAFLASFLSIMLFFCLNTAYAGIFDKAEVSVPRKTIAKIEKKTKEAYASETLSRIQKNPTSRVQLIASVTSFKITKITRDRPAGIAGGFYYIQGELTIELKAAEAVIEGQKVWVRKGQVFFTEHSWFRCAAIEDGYGDIVRITNMQLFKEKPSN